MEFSPGTVLSALRTMTRVGVPLGIFAACAMALGTRLQALSLEALHAHLGTIDAARWLVSLALCGASFWAVGRYDAVAHRHVRSGLPDRQARRSGTIAIALSQTLGFGLATGALARWRLLPGLTGRRALRLTAFVAASFVAALTVVACVTLTILPGPAGTFWPALAGTALMPGLFWLLFRYPEPVVFGHRIRLPSLPGFAAILLWTAVDLTAAAAALYVMVPASAGLAFVDILPVFMLALGAALLSGTPGGVGPFELVILTLLPQVPEVEMVGAIVAFRVLYYALPAILGAILLLRPFREVPRWGPVARPVPLPAAFPRSELGVMRQNGGRWMMTEAGGLVVWATAQTFTGLLDPIAHRPREMMRNLAHVARGANRVPCLYKCSGRTAVAARREGWALLHMADEAILSPPAFSLDLPSRRTLRRKLRAAQKAGLVVREDAQPPWRRMEQVDRDWQAERGPARGGTMGRFDPDYLRHQQIVTGYCNDTLVAFASFHASDHEWCLDLVRLRPDAPDGTMHAIVHRAIELARAGGIPRLSLAAVPACPDPTSLVYRRLAELASRRAGGPGLRQFKSAFAPRWQPLYMAAPSRPALILSALDIARVVLSGRPAEPDRQQAHVDDENYGFASRRAS